MATIHTGTTMAPTKLELLTEWLPRQPWYSGETPPSLSRAGGFRLDDPDGEVGIEFMLLTDDEGTTFSVPLTYRGAPLDGADDALVGTSEHGVLGTRWIYDAAHDPVAVAQLLEFVRGRVDAQHAGRSDTLDPSVGRRWVGEGEPREVEIVRVAGSDVGTASGSVECDWTRSDGTVARGTVAVVR